MTSQRCRKMAVNVEFTEDTIDGLKLPKAIALLKQHNITTGKSKSLLDIRCKLKAHLLQDRRPHGEILETLNVNAAEDHTLREELRDIHQAVIQCMEDLDKDNHPIIDRISKHYPQFLTYLRKQQQKLQGRTSRCPILVLGETGAGKSSFINLFLGEEILPCSLLSNTNMICEIQYGDTYWALMHPRQNDNYAYKVSAEDKQEFIRQLSMMIQSDRSDSEIYTRASVYVPCEILKSGIIFVDSPGIGDTEEMKDLLLNYVLEAASFVYIINSANAGGVQPDRLQALLKEVRDRVFTDYRDYRPECALFVCNKWDQVPVEQRSDVLEDTVSKLTGALGWPDCKPSQIFCLSAKETMYIQKEGYIVGQFAQLVKEIHRLIPLSREILLQESASHLVQFLDKCCFCMESSLDSNCTIDQRKDIIQETKGGFYKLKEDIDLFFKSQKKELSREIQNLAATLSAYLNEKDVKDMICDPNEYNISSDQEWPEAMVAIRAKLYTKLTLQIQTWESRNGRLESMSNKIAEEFRCRFPELDAKILQMERKFREDGISDWVRSDEDATFIPGFVSQTFDTLGIGMKILLGVSLSPVFLLGVIFRLPIFGILELKRKISSMSMVSTFRDNPNAAIRKYAENTLKSVADPTNLSSILLNELTPLFEYLDKQRERLKGNINADLAVIEQMEDTVKEQTIGTDQLRLSVSLRSKFEKLQGRMMHFQVMKLPTLKQMKQYFPMTSFDMTMETLSEGCIAELVTASVKFPEMLDGNQKVIIRKSRLPIDEATILSFLDEEKAYIRIKKPHLTKTLGFIKKDQEIWQVLPPLVGTLRNHMARCRGSKMEMKRVHYMWMEQVVQGLQFLFDRGYVHIDLSLDTVMVDSEDRIKLVNISKPKTLPRSLIPATDNKVKVLHFVHFHPDIISECDKVLYVKKYDMYAVGIMMYEMRTGQRAFEAEILNGNNHIHTLADFVNFLAKKKISLNTRAVEEDTKWQTAITKCLQLEMTSEQWLKDLMDCVKYQVTER